MPSLTTTVTTTTEVELSPRVKRQLLTELNAYQALKVERDAIDDAMAAHKQTIGELRESTGETTLSLQGFKVSLVTPTRSTLDKKLLLLNGVSMGQINESTITKATKPYEKISCPGEAE